MKTVKYKKKLLTDEVGNTALFNITESVCGRNDRRVAAVNQSTLCYYIILLHTEIDSRPSSCGIPTTHNIMCVYNIFNVIYIYYYYLLPTAASVRFCRADAVVSILYILYYRVMTAYTHTHTAYTYLLYEPSNTYCVYRTDMITYYYYCHRVYDEQRVAKTTVAPRTRRIKESCTRNPSKRAHRRNYNPEKEKEYGHRRYCYSGG